jgi:hypothetical protein
MQTNHLPWNSRPAPPPDLAPRGVWPRWVDHTTSTVDEDIEALPTDRDFLAMRTIYRATGGMARSDDLSRLLADHRSADCLSLARLVLLGDVFGFEWRDVFWIPMFQFDLRDMSVKHNPRTVVNELATEFDGWTIALWFSEANHWLGEARPVDLLEANLPAVLKAARADRIVAGG